ncbi:hypothetical protein SAMN05421504_107441 [Amycolatopsis xylanica]|uniref:Alpha/beta hydrolase n=1 Tax=Amycolatopsis xylanica TaxID=589385 RepID=A0A1H3NS80_9PSEU|nr:hypothetical protein [Amycolatopsis xylanica]SDY91781.1 hypothetical protein SAMN05421504_107441 [Amycolatopsis xylanica]
MADLFGFPSAEVQFDKDAHLVGDANAVLGLAADPGLTDLLVLSHGWNNDIDAARRLYGGLAGSLRVNLDQATVPEIAGRRLGIAGVIWPSRMFAGFELPQLAAAAAGSPADPDTIATQIEELRAVFPDPEAQRTLDEVAALVPRLSDLASARADFAEKLKTLVAHGAADREDASEELFKVPGGTLMDRLAVPVLPAPPGAPGGAAGFGGLLGGVFGAATNLLNFLSYYEMKARAGIIGELGVAPVLAQIHLNRPDLRIHLAGHSFGGRLVSAAAKPLPTGSIATMTLLQAAFSHYGFADDWSDDAGAQSGFFRDVLTDGTVRGPILITHTANDLCVGIAYAIASRIANQIAADIGDANSVYGGIGRNGALKTPGAAFAELLGVGGGYTWHAGVPNNLRADAFIMGHSDVTGQQVAYAMLSALAAT